MQIDDLNIKFPLNLIPRKEQLDALKFIKDSINTGSRNILCGLPTGVGKSYLTVMFMNWYRNYINPNANFDIITNSKILQEQYIKEYCFIKNFKGKANYYCDKYDCTVEVGLEICGALKVFCDDCPYKVARREWLESEVSMTNFHMFDSLCLYVPELFSARKSNVLIVDEAHDFEAVFADHITIKTLAKNLKRYGFSLKELEDYDDKIKKVNTLSKYVSFIEKQFLPDLERNKEYFAKELSKIHISKENRRDYSKYYTNIELHILRLGGFLENFKERPENWILDININKSDKMYSGKELQVSPIWVDEYLHNAFDKYDHIIFMSGTILDKNMFSQMNGLNPEQTVFYEIDSPFPIKNRPIFYLKVGKMSYNCKEDTFQRQKEWINKILKKHKNEKGVIHTTNYEISQWVQNDIMNERLIFHNNENREEMLQKHIMSDKPTVIVSPSLITGVDFKDDISRFAIILKIPYPSLNSNKIKARQKTRPAWYSWKTICDLCQSYGRSIRSVDDYANTYILDANLSTVLKYNFSMIPKFVSRAIKIMKI